MQIEPTRLNKLAAAGVGQVTPAEVSAPPAAESQSTAAAGQTDRLVFSQRAAEVQTAHEALAATADARAALVAQLKAQMAAGTYRANPEKIAEMLIPD
jgi:flagellar biosynthesis anti-sigma factor FlgM